MLTQATKKRITKLMGMYAKYKLQYKNSRPNKCGTTFFPKCLSFRCVCFQGITSFPVTNVDNYSKNI